MRRRMWRCWTYGGSMMSSLPSEGWRRTNWRKRSGRVSKKNARAGSSPSWSTRTTWGEPTKRSASWPLRPLRKSWDWSVDYHKSMGLIFLTMSQRWRIWGRRRAMKQEGWFRTLNFSTLGMNFTSSRVRNIETGGLIKTIGRYLIDHESLLS